MCILYVDEHESIQRQLARGRAAIEHNKLVAESGEGELQEVRETDLSVKAAKRRFQLFVEGTMAANEALKRSFPYNLSTRLDRFRKSSRLLCRSSRINRR